MNKEIQAATNTTNKFVKLILGIIFDLIGIISYFFPGIGESFDIVWAPVSGFLLMKMYKGKTGKVAGVIGFLEEILPFSDVIPTFTLTWIYTYVLIKEEK